MEGVDVHGGRPHTDAYHGRESLEAGAVGTIEGRYIHTTCFVYIVLPTLYTKGQIRTIPMERLLADSTRQQHHLYRIACISRESEEGNIMRTR